MNIVTIRVIVIKHVRRKDKFKPFVKESLITPPFVNERQHQSKKYTKLQTSRTNVQVRTKQYFYITRVFEVPGEKAKGLRRGGCLTDKPGEKKEEAQSNCAISHFERRTQRRLLNCVSRRALKKRQRWRVTRYVRRLLVRTTLDTVYTIYS